MSSVVFAPLLEHVFGVRLRVLTYDDPLVGFVAHATFFHPYVEAVPFACRGHVLLPSLRVVGSLFYTLMTWYVSHDPAFPSFPTFFMFATTMVLCNFSERTRCSVGASSHLRTCFLYVVLFHSWTCAFSFPLPLYFPIADSTFLFALHLERFYF